MRIAPWLRLGLAVLLLSGCVSAFPEEALRSVNRAITMSARATDPTLYVNQRVILGGEILATRPRTGETEIEVLARPLRDDIPERSDRSEGRFLVTTAGFLDPAVFAPGRRLTVIGTVTGVEERKIGEVAYRYPVLATVRLQLWPREWDAPPPFYPGYPWGLYERLYPRPYY
ncbi:MAG TPA: Slp family lipoprotein [Methylomirabilota bacterium]|nr:Slp family lipoprotein [Methylomirabilota bacterium]